MENKKKAEAMKIWAATHGKLAKKVLNKKTKQSGKAAIKSVVDEKRVTGGQDISTLKSKPSKPKATPKPAAKPAAKTTPKKTTPKSTPATTSRPKQTVNGASLGSKLTPAEKKKRLAEMAKTGSATQGSNMPSNPALKSQPKPTRKGASGVRKTGSNVSKTKTSKPKRSRRQNRRSRSY